MKIESLFDQFGEAMYRYLTIKLGSARDAEDVLQEVFFRLVKYSTRLRFVRNLRVFVFRVARNEAERFLRSKIQEEKLARQPELLTEVLRQSYLGPDESSERFISEALAKVPNDQREVIVLKIFEGMTFNEIADISAESSNTIASRYRYGIEKMRIFLEEKG